VKFAWQQAQGDESHQKSQLLLLFELGLA